MYELWLWSGCLLGSQKVLSKFEFYELWVLEIQGQGMINLYELRFGFI